MGPLNGLRFRLAKIRPGLVGGRWPNAALDSLMGTRATRMLEGKVEVVGVAGRTLTEECGDRDGLFMVAGEAIDMEAEDVEEALEWE